MAKVEVVACAVVYHGGQAYVSGQTIELSAADAKLLIEQGLAEKKG